MQYWLKNRWPGFVQTPSQQWMTKALPVFMHTTVFRILQSWINSCFVDKWFVCMCTSEEELFYWEPNESKCHYHYCYQTSDMIWEVSYLISELLFIYQTQLIRPLIWYRRCPIWYKTSCLLYQMCYSLVWHPIYTLKSCSIDSGIWLIWPPITSWPCGNIIMRHVHSPLFPAQHLPV